MAHLRQQRGAVSERLARAHLSQAGYRIETTNVRFPVGEIDIVATDGETLCFVEVRSSRTDRFGGAKASIDARKRAHLIRAARWHISRLRELPPAIRFDVVAIDWRAGRPSIELIRNAFTADDA